MKIKIPLIIAFIIQLQSVHASNINVFNFSEFEAFLHRNNDTVYVINFWATWCVPCRKELPEFEKIHNDYKGDKVKVILVSLDFRSKMETSVIPFIEKNNIKAEVFLLDDPDSNKWIDKVNPEWSGSLPATVIYKNDHQLFFERELEYNDIKHAIDKLNNN
ncbi:MAG: TlpA family protein disulfide reductase [Bacteroidales bacterium]|nr:TlpA family protein disulfide reductase [Bacteroidales bacterium]